MSSLPPVANGPAFLTLDGVDCGFVGCRSTGAGSVIELQVGLSLNALVYDWIEAAWAGRQKPVHGVVSLYRTPEMITIRRATITDTRFPSLDARLKGQESSITLVLQARSLVRSTKSPVDDHHHLLGPQQHQWLRSNFRLEIDAVDCSRVFEVAAFAISTVSPSARPEHLPIIEVRFMPQSLGNWKQWQTAQGQPAKNGAIRFMATDLHTELAHVALVDVKLVRLLEPGPTPGRIEPPVVASITSKQMQLKRPAPT